MNQKNEASLSQPISEIKIDPQDKIDTSPPTATESC